MDKAKIKRELEKLAAEGLADVPVEEPVVEVEAAKEGEPDPKAKKKKEEEKPRENGLLETDHATRGFHLDVQLNPDQVVQAAEILDGEGLSIEAVTGVDWLADE